VDQLLINALIVKKIYLTRNIRNQNLNYLKLFSNKMNRFCDQLCPKIETMNSNDYGFYCDNYQNNYCYYNNSNNSYECFNATNSQQINNCYQYYGYYGFQYQNNYGFHYNSNDGNAYNYEQSVNHSLNSSNGSLEKCGNSSVL
jgi:hypothetical protein